MASPKRLNTSNVKNAASRPAQIGPQRTRSVGRVITCDTSRTLVSRTGRPVVTVTGASGRWSPRPTRP